MLGASCFLNNGGLFPYSVKSTDPGKTDSETAHRSALDRRWVGDSPLGTVLALILRRATARVLSWSYRREMSDGQRPNTLRGNARGHGGCHRGRSVVLHLRPGGGHAVPHAGVAGR